MRRRHLDKGLKEVRKQAVGRSERVFQVKGPVTCRGPHQVRSISSLCDEQEVGWWGWNEKYKKGG